MGRRVVLVLFLVLILFVILGYGDSVLLVSAATCDNQPCSVSRDCCPNFLCINQKCTPCVPNAGSNCPESELGKKKCVAGWSGISYYNEVRECKLNTYSPQTNCYQYLKVDDCKSKLLACKEDGQGGASCACPQSCTPGQKRCLERNSLPISPAGPDEIQQCNNDGCGWTAIQSCSMDQDCVNEQCVDKQCPYCCPAGKTCSVPDYGQGCTTGTCCKSEYYCKSPTTTPPVTTPPTTTPPTTTPTTPPAIPPTETISTSELKNLLIEIIKDYFTADTPKLTVPEIKDLITAYFSTQANNIDLSTTGQYSGKKLKEIYNKIKETITPITPPVTPSSPGCTGGCTDGKVCWNNACCDPTTCLTGNIPLQPDEITPYYPVSMDIPAFHTLDINENIDSINIEVYSAYANLEALVIFPDGRQYSGLVTFNTGGNFAINSQHSGWPGLPDEYIPKGKYIIRVRAVSDFVPGDKYKVRTIAFPLNDKAVECGKRDEYSGTSLGCAKCGSSCKFVPPGSEGIITNPVWTAYCGTPAEGIECECVNGKCEPQYRTPSCSNCTQGQVCVGGKCAYAQALPLYMNSLDANARMYFAPGETKTFVYRVPEDARGFTVKFYPMSDGKFIANIKYPKKADGLPYTTVFGKSEFTIWAGYEGAVEFNVWSQSMGKYEQGFTRSIILQDYINPGDFIITMNYEVSPERLEFSPGYRGWGFMNTEIYP